MNVYVWSTGQDDNIGDSLLRRAYLDSLRPLGSLEIWIGKASSDFQTGLGLKDRDRTWRSFLNWYISAMVNAFRGKSTVAINAGEVPVSRRGAAKMLPLAVLLIVCKMTGRDRIWIGASVPNVHPVFGLPYRLVARLCNVIRWRDRRSEHNMGVRGVSPDWAFALGTEAGKWNELQTRTRLGVVLRGDRPEPSQEWKYWIRQLADDLHLRLTFVVQVRRDAQRAESLAAELGGDLLEWHMSDHASQEAAVRQLYSSCALVIGDRLHGLIVAASEGAVPLGWVESSAGKIGRHFEVIGLNWVAVHEGSDATALTQMDAEDLRQKSAELSKAISSARTWISATGTMLSRSAQ
ncbi:polysaccharide pyruvyl transferase family protein [Arthrobacter sp. Marseille-P9274]|uniref:polysaccharide pyruvyl transferase family protein n=1 Tax=Arthrobacter sp. Marseille-P9274 TaxID=2866572 RepID=UPI0034D18D50